MNGEELKFRVFLFMQELQFPVPAHPGCMDWAGESTLEEEP